MLLLSPPARAQRPAGEEIARQQLIERAQRAHASGAHAEALEVARRAAQIRRTPTLLLFIAEEQEEVGALADAYASAQQCAREAELDPEAKLREKAIDRCRVLAERLKGRVSYVVVNVPEPPAGLSVTLSGQQLNHAAIGVPYVITPGRVVVEASAPGRVPYRVEVEVPEAKTINVTVSLAPDVTPAPCPANRHADGAGRCVDDSCRIGMIPAGDGAKCCWPGQTWEASSQSCAGIPQCPTGTEARGTACVPKAETLAAPVPSRPEPAGSRPTFKPLVLTMAAVGTAALVTAGIVWLVSDGKFDDLKQHCNDIDGCTVQDRRAKINEIKELDGWSAGLAVAGAAVVAAGGVVHWLGRSGAEERGARLHVDPITRAVTIEGRF